MYSALPLLLTSVDKVKDKLGPSWVYATIFKQGGTAIDAALEVGSHKQHIKTTASSIHTIQDTVVQVWEE